MEMKVICKFSSFSSNRWNLCTYVLGGNVNATHIWGISGKKRKKRKKNRNRKEGQGKKKDIRTNRQITVMTCISHLPLQGRPCSLQLTSYVYK